MTLKLLSHTRAAIIFVLAVLCMQCGSYSPGPLQTLAPGDHIVLIGNNLCSRMMIFGYFETELHQRFPEHKLTIRNMCDGGNTPGFRPHPGRVSPWAFPGADSFLCGTGPAFKQPGTFRNAGRVVEATASGHHCGFFRLQ